MAKEIGFDFVEFDIFIDDVEAESIHTINEIVQYIKDYR